MYQSELERVVSPIIVEASRFRLLQQLQLVRSKQKSLHRHHVSIHVYVYCSHTDER